MLRVVIDTNVFVSSLISPKGKPADLIRAWKDNRIQVIVSPQIILEISKTLQKGKLTRRISPKQAFAIIHGIMNHAAMVSGEVVLKLCRDPADDKFIACAVEGRADYIVTGDSDLLDLKTYEGVEIVTVESFLKILSRLE